MTDQELAPATSSFDYASLSPDLAKDARAVAQRVRAAHVRTMQAILEMGRELSALKTRLGHGRFGRWLAAEFGAVARTAQNYMLAADRFGDDSEIISLLPPATVYALAAPSTPEPVRAEVVRRLSLGERLNPAEVGALVRAGRSQRQRLGAARKADSDDSSPRLLQRERRSEEPRGLEIEEPAGLRDQALGELVALLQDGLGNDFPRCLELMHEAGLGWAAERMAACAAGAPPPGWNQALSQGSARA